MTAMDAIICTALPLKGTVTVPPDKAICHRAVLIAALAEGRTEIQTDSPAPYEVSRVQPQAASCERCATSSRPMACERSQRVRQRPSERCRGS